MDLYCTKHKKRLEERYYHEEQKIHLYCVDCEIERNYNQKWSNSTSSNKMFIKRTKKTLLFSLLIGMVIVIFLPLGTLVKVLLCSILFLLMIRNILHSYQSRLPDERMPVWDDIRAKSLNQSSIQANEVSHRKRQWKKDFIQQNKGRAWTEEDWQQFLRQYYRKD
ncbi:hypothetical protein FIU87_10120 [Bacillus sp. THAF10]|uniref:hypothetical protein n=1 Tax=Bacillus sp. THAF10 TaxID=2587848 RepID=UPI00126803A8|nr:hypothetical protein [Bacillus sp. THAF10]QFT89001.1 hypothetical protein FIU87_10120 [Bacillus sp. THAF10]